MTLDDFTIKDIQTPKPKEEANVDKIVDGLIGNILSTLGYNEFCDTYKVYVGQGKVFRNEIAKIKEYKGNREGLKPLFLTQAKQRMVDRHHGEWIEGIEADDAIAIDTLEGYINWKETQDDDDKVVAVTSDKDAKGTAGWLFNPDKMKEPMLIEGLGELFLDAKKNVDGYGRIWHIFQVCSSDVIDNYAANSATNKKWGPKSAYDKLRECKTDKQAWEKAIEIYKELYPEPFEFIGWQGDTLNLTWFDVMQENVHLAFMLPSVDYRYDLKKILKNLGIKV